MRHHAIVVTGPNESHMNIATVRAACELIAAKYSQPDFSIAVSEPTKPTINDHSSFFVAPDGSKEGWPESNSGDKARDEIVSYLRSLCFSDGSTLFNWVEVQFGDEEGVTKVVRDSDHPETA